MFKPAGVPARDLETIALRLDELEALRLADRDGLYHDEAARRMGVSRATFGRLVTSARQKVAAALLGPKAIEIKGGRITMTDKRRFQCNECGYVFDVPFGTGRPEQCPQCSSTNVSRADSPGAGGRCRRRGACGGGGRGRRHRRRAAGRPIVNPAIPTPAQPNQENET